MRSGVSTSLMKFASVAFAARIESAIDSYVFAIAFGVLLDTFLVRSLLVPALVFDIGPKVWWPSSLSRVEENGKPEAPAG